MRSRQFLALFALGFVGVLALVPVAAALIARKPPPPGFPRLPFGVLVALSLVQPTLLMAAGVAIGVRLAPRFGLRSHLAEAVSTGAPIWPALRQEAPLAVAVALVAAAVTAALDVAFKPFMGEAWRRLEQDESALGGTSAELVAGVFYGGLTEELMLRWGVLSLFVWLASWIAGGPATGSPRGLVAWSAIALSALLFGLGHLPAVSALVPLTPVIVARTVLLNAIGGVAFGWLFWRRSLEAAMMAHASSHVVMFVVRLVAR